MGASSDDWQLILPKKLIVAVRRAPLRSVGSVADQGDLVTRAVDVLMSGVYQYQHDLRKWNG